MPDDELFDDRLRSAVAPLAAEPLPDGVLNVRSLPPTGPWRWALPAGVIAAAVVVAALVVRPGPPAVADASPTPAASQASEAPSSSPSPSPTASPTEVPTPTPLPAPSAPVGMTGVIAYADGGQVTPQVYLLDLATGERQQLTHLTPEDGQLTGMGTGMRPALTCMYAISGLSWSPDGSMLTFALGGCEGVIFTVEMDGTLHRIGEGVGPVWAPDGSFIAYQPNAPYSPCGSGCLDPSLGPWEILRADPLGRDAPVPVTDNGGTFTPGRPIISRDGQSIAFIGPAINPDPANSHWVDAYVIGIDGSGQRIVQEAAVPEAWTPDGALILSNEIDGQVIRLDLDSGASTVLADEGGVTSVAPDVSAILQGASDPESGEPVTNLRLVPNGEVIAIVPGSTAAWSSDARYFAVGFWGQPGIIGFFDAQGRELGGYSVTDGPGISIAWQPQP